MLNFGERMAGLLKAVPETMLHPHHPDEKADCFSALAPGAAEVETLTLLNALVYFSKPEMVLETGTGGGYATAAIASALRSNGSGRLHTVEIHPSVSADAQQRIQMLDPELPSWITFHVRSSMEVIADWNGPPFDFVFFDSLLEFRHLEFLALAKANMLSAAAVCVFHDTSRLRGAYMPDYNPEMIAALDEQSHGRQWMEFTLSRGVRMIKMG